MKLARVAVAAGLMFVSLALLTLVFENYARDIDFIGYWAAGKLMRAHTNPYSHADLLRVEHAAGGTWSTPIVMRNPPWSLFLALPLGYCSLPVAIFLWFSLMLGACVVSIRLLSAGSKPPPVVVYLFAPILYCAMSGQCPLFFLLGIALFFQFHDRLPWIAGLALVLPAIKPHLFLLFWPILLVECIRRRKYRVVAGAVLALAVACAIASALDPHVFAEYLATMRTEGIENTYMPNIPTSLRFLFVSRPVWLQIAPGVLGLIWAGWFYWRHRASWDWCDQGALLLGVSILVSPYSWPFDQVLFLPAIVKAFSSGVSRATMAYFVVLTAVAAFMITKIHLPSPAYVWTGPAWLLWVLWARRQARLAAARVPVLAAS
ncbi:MAG TPA: glycosyltransferase family 87 protein [Acidobacteriaceae bacterium]